MNRYYDYNFLKSLLFRQNNYHRFGVIGHTLAVTYHAIRNKDYRFVVPALLHDFGKPFTANPDEKDLEEGLGNLSFTNHEELSYRIIKDWNFITEWDKLIVRHHYLIRGMKKAKQKGNFAKYRRLRRTWDRLDDTMKEDLGTFLKYDDLGK